MVVVLIIAILAAIAIPTFSTGRYEQVAYDDAAAIVRLFREARSRSRARGTAVMVLMSAGGADRGTYQMWEAVAPTPGNLGAPRTPISTCMSPTVWPPNGGPTAVMIDGVDMNGGTEQQGGINSSINDYLGNANLPAAAVCYTPLGRSYYSPTSPPTFIIGNPQLGALDLIVRRANGGIRRHILVSPLSDRLMSN